MKLKIRYNKKYDDIQFLRWEGTNEELARVGFAEDTTKTLPHDGTIDGYIKYISSILGEPECYGDIVSWGYNRKKAKDAKAIGLSFSHREWAEIDKCRGELSRSAFIRFAVKEALAANRRARNDK